MEYYTSKELMDQFKEDNTLTECQEAFLLGMVTWEVARTLKDQISQRQANKITQAYNGLIDAAQGMERTGS